MGTMRSGYIGGSTNMPWFPGSTQHATEFADLKSSGFKVVSQAALEFAWPFFRKISIKVSMGKIHLLLPYTGQDTSTSGIFQMY